MAILRINAPRAGNGHSSSRSFRGLGTFQPIEYFRTPRYWTDGCDVFAVGPSYLNRYTQCTRRFSSSKKFSRKVRWRSTFSSPSAAPFAGNATMCLPSGARSYH